MTEKFKYWSLVILGFIFISILTMLWQMILTEGFYKNFLLLPFPEMGQNLRNAFDYIKPAFEWMVTILLFSGWAASLLWFYVGEKDKIRTPREVRRRFGRWVFYWVMAFVVATLINLAVMWSVGRILENFIPVTMTVFGLFFFLVVGLPYYFGTLFFSPTVLRTVVPGSSKIIRRKRR